jgi:hypothetical protein
MRHISFLVTPDLRWEPLAASGALRLLVMRLAVRAGALAAAGGQWCTTLAGTVAGGVLGVLLPY